MGSVSEVFTYCPGCDSRILPGQAVVSVGDEDPDRDLWHVGCRKIWEYDEMLGAKMDAATKALYEEKK